MSRTTGMDAFFDPSIFRNDKKLLILSDYHKAVLRPVRLAPHPDGDDYEVGTVLGKYSSGDYSGFWGPYSDSGTSGLDTAVGVLLNGVENQEADSAASTPAAIAIMGGGVVLKKDALVGYTSAAKGDLGAREFTDSSGIDQVIF